MFLKTLSTAEMLPAMSYTGQYYRSGNEYQNLCSSIQTIKLRMLYLIGQHSKFNGDKGQVMTAERNGMWADQFLANLIIPSIVNNICGCCKFYYLRLVFVSSNTMCEYSKKEKYHTKKDEKMLLCFATVATVVCSLQSDFQRNDVSCMVIDRNSSLG